MRQSTPRDLSLVKILNTTVSSFKNNPALFLPFVIFSTFEYLILGLLYLAPRVPFKLVLAPPIRTLWGEKFLHYPMNFLLLPKLASNSRMVLTVLLGSLLTGMAVAIVAQIYQKESLNLGKSLKLAISKYVSLLAVVFSFVILYYALSKVISLGLMKYFVAGNSRLLFLGIGAWMGPISIAINFILAVLVQSLFVYAIPILIVDKEKLVRAVVKSFVMFKRAFFKTILLISLPMLLFIPLIVLEYNSALLIDKVFPESVLLVLCAAIIVNSLIIDPLITVSVTIFYLFQKEKAFAK